MRSLISILLVLWPLTMSAFPEATQVNCVINLRRIAQAKQALQLDKHLASGATCEPAALAPYIPTMPRCPAGGVYTIGPIGTEPSCSVAGHSEAAIQEDFRRQLARDRLIQWSLWAGAALVLAGLGWRLLRSRTRGAADKGRVSDGRRHLLLMVAVGCVALLAIGVLVSIRERDRAAARKRAAAIEIQQVQDAMRQYDITNRLLMSNVLAGWTNSMHKP